MIKTVILKAKVSYLANVTKVLNDKVDTNISIGNTINYKGITYTCIKEYKGIW